MCKTVFSAFAVLLLAGALAVPIEEKPEVVAQREEQPVKVADPVPVVAPLEQQQEYQPIQLKSAIVPAVDDVPAGPEQTEDLVPAPEGAPGVPNPETTSDLETANSFWGGYGGWGYRRPYYGGWGGGWGRRGWGGGYGGYGGYGGGYGRGYGGYGGWGGGWGGRGYGGWSGWGW